MHRLLVYLASIESVVMSILLVTLIAAQLTFGSDSLTSGCIDGCDIQRMGSVEPVDRTSAEIVELALLGNRRGVLRRGNGRLELSWIDSLGRESMWVYIRSVDAHRTGCRLDICG